MRGLLVTGTDTDVGKTYICSHILRTLRLQGREIGAYKPVCSGAMEPAGQPEPTWADIEALHLATGKLFDKKWICPQRFLAPLAPPVAATIEKSIVDEELLVSGLQLWSNHVEGIVVEGIGGWKCPISENLTVEDFAKSIGFPVLVVSAQKLGTINHTLLTIEAILNAGLEVAGVVLNCGENMDSTFLKSNVDQILRFAEVPFLSIAEFQQTKELRCHPSSTTINWWNSMKESPLGF